MAAIMGVTEVDAVRQELIANLVQMTLKEKSILLPTVMDYSSFATPGNKSVAIPRRDQFSAADKAENTALTAQNMTFSTDVIALDKHKAIYVALEDIADVQAKPQVRAEIIQEMANELALQVDKDIITELKDVSTATPDHLLDYQTAGGPVELGDFAEARKLLRQQSVPMMDNSLFALISPVQEKAMLGIDNFISAEKYGAREALLNAEIGRVFGIRVLVHNELEDADMLVYHKSHVGYASQFKPSLETDRSLADVATEYLMQLIYGVETLDVTATGGKRGVHFNAVGA